MKKEIIKWFDAGVIYQSLIVVGYALFQCVLKKGGIIVVPNEKNELIPMRPVTGWRVYMDYRKLNVWTKKTIFLCPSWIRCWIDLSKRSGTIS